MLLAAFGTPFILAIATAIAIPGITFGFPAYLVYKVGKSVDGNKKKRIFLQILSFFGGLLASPIIAGESPAFSSALQLNPPCLTSRLFAFFSIGGALRCSSGPHLRLHFYAHHSLLRVESAPNRIDR